MSAMVPLLRVCLLAVVASPSFVPAESVLAQESLSDVVAGLQRRYAKVQVLMANFEQRYQAPGINQVESGTFWMKKPGLMRWEYRLPEQKLFIADGRETFLYVPEDGQVMVRSFTDADLHSTPLQFLLGKGDILRAFKVVPENEFRSRVEGTALIRLEPNRPEPDYAFLVLEVDASTYDLRRIVIRERTGSTSEFFLTDLRTDVRVPGDRFRFRVPTGVEIIRLDEK